MGHLIKMRHNIDLLSMSAAPPRRQHKRWAKSTDIKSDQIN